MDNLEEFEVVVSGDNGQTCVQLRGELDLASTPQLLEGAELAWRDHQPAHLVIDARELRYCDSAGIRALLQLAARCEKDGGRFRLVGAHGSVRRVFEITETIEALRVE